MYSVHTLCSMCLYIYDKTFVLKVTCLFGSIGIRQDLDLGASDWSTHCPCVAYRVDEVMADYERQLDLERVGFS